MTYLVIGSGCVGTYLASTLAKNGARVMLKSRSAPSPTVASIAAKAGVECAQSLAPLAASIRAGERAPLDAIFVATKTYHLENAAAELAEHGDVLRPKLATVGCYNGHVLGIDRTYGDALGGTFCKALVPGGYSFKECGTGFNVTNAGQKWALLSRTQSVQTLAAQLAARGVGTVAGGFEADTRKYLVNNTANLVSVIANTNCNGLVSDPALRTRMHAIFVEASRVLQASPVHAPHFPDLPLAELEEQILSGIASYGEHYPSSCKDFRAGRDIEVDSLNGYICSLGKELGIPTPVNEAVVSDVKFVLKQQQKAPDAIDEVKPPQPNATPIVRTPLRGNRIITPHSLQGAAAASNAPAGRRFRH
mmetsp:Transcript_26790/g.72267  ORF Transcript_26790/g.72267 Transcript_26790/m.72267 type:complete len:363 (+) Transcript_26790:148-1236(+)